MNKPKLSVAMSTLDAGCLVRVAGTIDESTDAQALLPNGSDVVLFDLDGVRRITSYGVLQWVKALKELRARYYAFMRCRPSIVRQFNMVAGFGKHGEVLSIYLPYFCEDCDQEFETLLDLRSDYLVLQNSTPPEARCPTCGNLAEFDDVPKSYLAFSSDYPKPNPSELAQKLMQEATRLGSVVPRGQNTSVRPPDKPGRISHADLPFTQSESRTGSVPPPPAVPSPREAPAATSATGVVSASDAGARSVDHLRKLQDELDVTRNRLSRMIKERKSKS